MNKLGRGHRDKVQQFIAITGTSEKVALQALKSSDWHLEGAFDIFYSQPNIRVATDSRHLEELYNRYKDTYADMILVDGISLLCNDLQVDPQDIVTLVLSWHMKAATMCEFSRQEFIGGLQSLGVDTIQKFREKIPSLRAELKDEQKFREIYNFAFGWAKEKGQKSLSLDTAIGMWQLLFAEKHWPLVDHWCDFLQARHNKSITRDTWSQLLEFAKTIDPGSRWRGKCQAGEAFSSSTCNKKVIGARYYMGGYEAEKKMVEESQMKPSRNMEFKSPRDSSGHGSHTASTAAGRFVYDMNYDGLAIGAARGGAPIARIAIYKACWDSGCYDADLLAAFNDAIEDGVDIISLSLGPESPQGDYFNDAISVGSFHAMRSGILVVSSVGNAGTRGSATNLAPWMFTVAASTTDREFVSTIRLGNGENLMGVSLNTHQMNSSIRTIDASEANAGYFTPYQSSYCLESSLNATKARGKVLVCRHSSSSSESRLEKSLVVKKAGAVGMILLDEREDGVAIPFIIPAASIGREAGDRVLSYLNQTRRPKSLISPARTLLKSQSAPRVAAFSSKGPNSLTPEILKPDIMAPGLNILAAWSPSAKKLKFNIISGTSMSCPHVTGLVALIKAVHPDWSPAAIKSAVMTTATVLNKNHTAITADPLGKKANPFAYGAGFPDPARILNPGLIYDTQPSDYKNFLCSIGYDNTSLQQITGDSSLCSKPASSASDLNYPSITAPNLKNSISITRTVTNVGKSNSVYQAVVYPPRGVNVTVIPKFLVFTSYGQKMNFTVNFRVDKSVKNYVFGSLSWKSKEFRVTSPLVVGVASSRIGMI